MFAKMPLDEFVCQAASGAPTPGGGGVAALAGSLGAAMASMAANFTVGKPRFAAVEAEVKAILAKLAAPVERLLAGVDGDAEAFASISAAYGLPKGTDAEKAARGAAIRAALAASMAVPGAMLRECVAAAELLPGLARVANPNLLSDVEVAAIMLDAAGRAARVNVLVNAAQLPMEDARPAIAAADLAVERLAGLLNETLGEAARRRG